VYVKGHYDDKSCRVDATLQKSVSLSVPFTSCDVRRQRSVGCVYFIGNTQFTSHHLIPVDREQFVFFVEIDDDSVGGKTREELADGMCENDFKVYWLAAGHGHYSSHIIDTCSHLK
jgi:hypothetical protein